ncbi:MAG: hypothetical protein RDU14_16130 [Melioribacteraceae bacterium]|nr:hypothetical protein [Melioribacteraceae bacterium]
MKITKTVIVSLVLIIVAGCSSLMLKPADFSWPIENVLKVDANGFISEDRYTFSINVKQLFFAEYKDSTNYSGKEIRIIRDKLGYYFMTAKDFKNVYVFIPVENGMKLENKVLLSEIESLTSPVFNQKNSHIELLDGSIKYLLNHKGIVR